MVNDQRSLPCGDRRCRHSSTKAMNNVGQAIKGTVDAGSSEEAITKIRAMGNFPTKIRERSGGGKAKSSRRRQRSARGGPATNRPDASEGQGQAADAVHPAALDPPGRRPADLAQPPDSRRAAEAPARCVWHPPRRRRRGSRCLALRGNGQAPQGVQPPVYEHGPGRRARRRVGPHSPASRGVHGEVRALRRKIIGAMIYPSAVITFAALIVHRPAGLVVPKFQSIFEDQGDKLPALTQSLLDMSDWMAGGGGCTSSASRWHVSSSRKSCVPPRAGRT